MVFILDFYFYVLVFGVQDGCLDVGYVGSSYNE